MQLVDLGVAKDLDETKATDNWMGVGSDTPVLKRSNRNLGACTVQLAQEQRVAVSVT